EKESRLQLGCALFTCVTMFVVLCIAGVIVGFGVNLTTFNLGRVGASNTQAVDRLALIGADGNVYVVDRNGGAQVAVTDNAAMAPNAPVRRGYAYPNWSPDNQRIAFVGVSSEGNGKATLYTANARDGKSVELFTSADVFPFYLYWSPDSQRLAFLTQGRSDTLGLNLANADGTGNAELGRGNPLYFSWSPDSQSVVSHIGGSRRSSADAFIGLHSVVSGNQAQNLAIAPANFLAPAWSPDGTEFISALMGVTNRDDTLIVTDRRGEHPRSIASFAGAVAFNWSPDGKQIAYLQTQRTTNGLKSELHLVKPDGSGNQTLTDESPIAFFWSPDGTRIAYLVFAGGSQGALQFTSAGEQQTVVRVTLKVIAVADQQVTTLITFVPTDSFATLIQYFDQYAQSLRIWSPDSQSLVFCAEEKNGDESVYVVGARNGDEPQRIAGGSIAAWSWK
ncbi:MAG: hypothetical protein ABI874_08000, partial [Chloroflexota bacterium]